MTLEDKRIVITGGTGSLGRVLVRRILTGELGYPESVTVFSRDEAKQSDMRLSCDNELLKFVIGDVRDFHSVASVLRDADIVISAAALKQVPTCEYFPFEAVKTNIGGPENIVRAIREHHLQVETVIGVSTDKAVHPTNVMGMTKAIQERLFISANLMCKQTRFVCVRYGNVLASRGSVIPLFHDQIRRGGPVTVTDGRMTRFLMSLDRAVDTIFAVYQYGITGETYVPHMASVNMMDLAKALVNDRNIPITVTGIRPGEKLDEILISEEECRRTSCKRGYYIIQPILPELGQSTTGLSNVYSSNNSVMLCEEIKMLLKDQHLRVEDVESGELLR